MKYKIEIWQNYNVTETYESNDIDDVLQWYINYWSWCYECGNCAFYLYKDDVQFTFDEEYELGFHTYE